MEDSSQIQKEFIKVAEITKKLKEIDEMRHKNIMAELEFMAKKGIKIYQRLGE
jgi:hypothetical protein